jgi:hypothetical protein
METSHSKRIIFLSSFVSYCYKICDYLNMKNAPTGFERAVWHGNQFSVKRERNKDSPVDGLVAQ